MADSQSGHDSSTNSWVMENKQTTETLGVLLQGLKLYLASFFFFFLKEVHTCTARSILFYLLMVFFQVLKLVTFYA